jgi:hypothetical protein
MKFSWKQIAEMVLVTLSPEELQQSAVYMKPALLEAGTAIATGRQLIPINEPSVMVFVDLFPAANWGHPCRYLLIAAHTGNIQVVDSQFPPGREGLKIVHKGERVENWMLMTDESLE